MTSSCSKRDNILWRSLVGVTLLCCSLIVYCFIFYGNIQCSSHSACTKSTDQTAEKFRSKTCNTVCNSNDCVYISNYMLRFLNQTVDPCTNFYNFACGKLVDKYDGHKTYTILDVLADDLYINLREVIVTSNEPEGTAMHKLKIVYDSCLNKGSSERNVTQELLSFLGHAGLHNWPHLSSNFSFINQDLLELLGKLNSYKQDIFFTFHSSDYNESDETLISLQIRLLFDTYGKESKKFEHIITRILQILGMNSETIETTWNSFITMKKHVDKLNEDVREHSDNDTDYKLIKCQEEKEESRIMLCQVLDSVVKHGNLSSRFHKDHVNVSYWELQYLDNVYGVIKNSSDREIANYIALSVLLNNLDHMNFFIRKSVRPELDQPYMDGPPFSAYLQKWKYCVVWVAENMPYALGPTYVEKMFSNKVQKEIDELIQEITNTTADFILQQEWIGELAKKEAAKEVKEQQNILHFVTDIMRNKSEINLRHKKFNPTLSSFMENILMYNKFIFTSTLLNGEYVPDYHDINPFTVNAFGGGYIYLTYGVLLPPVFKYGFPKLFNIAKIGSIAAHETGHTLFFFLDKYKFVFHFFFSATYEIYFIKY